MSTKPTDWRRWVWPVRSRKVLIALATVIVAYLAEVGLNVNEEIVVTILGVGVAVILGIAHEDAAAKSAAGSVLPEIHTLTATCDDDAKS
jgi:hypothetical protein